MTLEFYNKTCEKYERCKVYVWWNSQYGSQLCKSSISVATRSKAWVCGLSLAGICGFEFRQGSQISVCCECCVLSGRDLCVGMISRPEESYRVCMCVYVCVCVCEREREREREIVKPRKGGGHDPLEVVVSRKEKLCKSAIKRLK